MPPLDDLGGREWAVAQHNIDPERHVHVPDVYGIWTAKPWIVKQAKDLDPYHSEYFFWVSRTPPRLSKGPNAHPRRTFSGRRRRIPRVRRGAHLQRSRRCA